MKTIAFLSIGDKGLKIGYKKTGWKRNIGEHLSNEGQKVIIIHYGDRNDCVEAANKVIRHHNQYFKKHGAHPSAQFLIDFALKNS